MVDVAVQSAVIGALTALAGTGLSEFANVFKRRGDREDVRIERMEARDRERRAVEHETSLRWLDDRRRAHAAFLAAARERDTHVTRALFIAQGIPLGEVDDDRDNAADDAMRDALAVLELIAGEAARAAAREWDDALDDASMHHVANRLRQQAGEELQFDEWAAETERARLARDAYITAARADLLTART